MNELLYEPALLARLDTLTKPKTPCTRPITTEEILKQVFSQIDPADARAVLLHGSRATGRENPCSDVDLVVLTERKTRTILSFCDADGIRYHAYVFNKADSDGVTAEKICRPFYGMRPIYDPEGAGRHLTEALNAAEKRICAKLPKEDPEGRDYLLRLVDLMKRADADTAFFTRVKILYEFPAFLASYHGYRLIGFKNVIDCLLRDNRDLALVYADALRPESGSKELENLIRRAFDGLCGLDVLNTDFSHSEKSYDISVGGETMYRLYGRCTDFMEAIDALRLQGMEAYDFYLQCKEQAPTLFRRLNALAVPQEN